ncbi:MAG: translation initiation factor IF-2 N-terminal domain-containing protein, partial [bacterium]|nr:translation initiation factor IF-2 N-terminal domain-containing protein [bacterium]
MAASADKPLKIFQLAKQLNTSHRDIIEFLKGKGIEASLNTTLDPDSLKLVNEHFAEDKEKAGHLRENREQKRIEEEERRSAREKEREDERKARDIVQKRILRSLKEEPKPPEEKTPPVEKKSAESGKKPAVLEKKTLDKEKEEKQKAAEEIRKLKEEQEARKKEEEKAKKALEGEAPAKGKTDVNAEDSKKKKKSKATDEQFENKLEKLKQRHKGATKRIQVSEMESRLERFRQSKNIEDLESGVPASGKRRQKKKKAV